MPTPRKLQLLTELLSEEKVSQMITDKLGQLVYAGPSEPESSNGPVFWIDTDDEPEFEPGTGTQTAINVVEF